MYKFKRILAIFITVILLSATVGSDYFDATHMTYVEATAGAVAGGITAATLFQICLLVGSVFAISWAAGEVIDNQEEIARAGKNFIDSVKEIPEGWLFTITDTSTGQDYVFGNEVIEYIQACTWLAILNGAPGPDNDNNDNKNDDDKKGVIDLVSPSNIANFFTLGATWVIAHASELYQKWVNGDEMTEAELAAIEPLVSGYCNQYDVAAQWSGKTFGYSVTVKSIDGGWDRIYNISASYGFPVAGYLNMSHADQKEYSLKFFNLDSFNNVTTSKFTGIQTARLLNGSNSGVWNYDSVGVSATGCDFFSYSTNLPVFASMIDAENYLKGIGDVTNALNYAKVYRHADWLSDDWAGQLVDPFTNIGLTLSQLLGLMKALGLNAVGNNLSPEELADLIRRSLPDVNPDLLPGETPVTIPDPAPGTDPVYYPSPDSHPIPVKPTPDPNPGTDPDPQPNPGAETIDIDDIVPDTTSGFSDISGTLKRKFPFSLPWDIHYLLTGLANTPKTPVYYLPLVIERLGIDELIVIDMSDFEDISKLSRAMLSLLWAYGLINWTVKIVSVRKEE